MAIIEEFQTIVTNIRPPYGLVYESSQLGPNYDDEEHFSSHNIVTLTAEQFEKIVELRNPEVKVITEDNRVELRKSEGEFHGFAVERENLLILSMNTKTSEEYIVRSVHMEPGVVYGLGFYKNALNPNEYAVVATVSRRPMK